MSDPMEGNKDLADRVEEVLKQLTNTEKVWLLSGRDMWTAGGVPRLGLPPLRFTDGPNGARGTSMHGDVGAAAAPCEIAMASTFNEALVERVADYCGEECVRRGANVLLGPTLNLQRFPVSGRHYECYSEDPYLTATMGAAWIRGVQRHVAACAKHFIGNDQETDRNTSNSVIDERTLREVYMVPFETAVEAGVESVMCGYNRLQRDKVDHTGVYGCENSWLLERVLRVEWGFKGWVISDWFGNRSTLASLAAGLNIEMPGVEPRSYGGYLADSVHKGQVTSDLLDKRCRPVLRTMLNRKHAQSRPEDFKRRSELLRQAASESIILLKNELCGGRPTLPLDHSRLRRLAVIGPNAAKTTIQGGGSSRVNAKRSPSILEALSTKLSSSRVEVDHHSGCDFEYLPRHMFTNEMMGIAIIGNCDENGQPVGTNLWLAFIEKFMSVSSWFSNQDWFRRLFMPILRKLGVRLVEAEEVAFKAPDSTPQKDLCQLPGCYWLYWILLVLTCGFIGFRIVDITHTTGLDVKKAGFHWRLWGAIFALLFLLFLLWIRRSGPIEAWRLKLECMRMDAAEKAASKADACLLVLGTHGWWEIESVDQPHPELLGRQNELVSRVVAAARGPVVAVLNVGSPKELPWIDSVPAVLLGHFGGEEYAPAVVDALLGVTNPAGRLPTTWPQHLQDMPACKCKEHPDAKEAAAKGGLLYAEGLHVGYRGFGPNGPITSATPLYHFGHGLSYTSFSYGQLEVKQMKRCGEEGGPTALVQAMVRNEGNLAGAEVAQLYTLVPDESVKSSSLRTLRGFHRTAVLAPGARETFTLVLGPRALGSRFDPGPGIWRPPTSGTSIRIEVGRSSADVHAVVHTLVLAGLSSRGRPH